MLERYLHLDEFIIQLGRNDAEICAALPSCEEILEIKRLVEKLEETNIATQELQKENLNLLEIRAIFDCLIEDIPEFASKIGVNAVNTRYAPFENGLWVG